ncbi:unnamed protein product [Amoebophrya sp. A120]|nr:unnamed protein product [Amoebophrya sp. A120]|eukprot:GSA120T00007627001.1
MCTTFGKYPTAFLQKKIAAAHELLTSSHAYHERAEVGLLYLRDLDPLISDIFDQAGFFSSEITSAEFLKNLKVHVCPAITLTLVSVALILSVLANPANLEPFVHIGELVLENQLAEVLHPAVGYVAMLLLSSWSVASGGESGDGAAASVSTGSSTSETTGRAGGVGDASGTTSSTAASTQQLPSTAEINCPHWTCILAAFSTFKLRRYHVNYPTLAAARTASRIEAAASREIRAARGPHYNSDVDGIHTSAFSAPVEDFFDLAAASPSDVEEPPCVVGQRAAIATDEQRSSNFMIVNCERDDRQQLSARAADHHEDARSPTRREDEDHDGVLHARRRREHDRDSDHDSEPPRSMKSETQIGIERKLRAWLRVKVQESRTDWERSGVASPRPPEKQNDNSSPATVVYLSVVGGQEYAAYLKPWVRRFFQVHSFLRYENPDALPDPGKDGKSRSPWKASTTAGTDTTLHQRTSASAAGTRTKPAGASEASALLALVCLDGQALSACREEERLLDRKPQSSRKIVPDYGDEDRAPFQKAKTVMGDLFCIDSTNTGDAVFLKFRWLLPLLEEILKVSTSKSMPPEELSRGGDHTTRGNEAAATSYVVWTDCDLYFFKDPVRQILTKGSTSEKKELPAANDAIKVDQPDLFVTEHFDGKCLNNGFFVVKATLKMLNFFQSFTYFLYAKNPFANNQNAFDAFLGHSLQESFAVAQGKEVGMVDEDDANGAAIVRPVGTGGGEDVEGEARAQDVDTSTSTTTSLIVYKLLNVESEFISAEGWHERSAEKQHSREDSDLSTKAQELPRSSPILFHFWQSDYAKQPSSAAAEKQQVEQSRSSAFPCVGPLSGRKQSYFELFYGDVFQSNSSIAGSDIASESTRESRIQAALAAVRSPAPRAKPEDLPGCTVLTAGAQTIAASYADLDSSDESLKTPHMMQHGDVASSTRPESRNGNSYTAELSQSIHDWAKPDPEGLERERTRFVDEQVILQNLFGADDESESDL